MKAKIKETGEIIDVEHVCNPDDSSDYAFYEKVPDGCTPDKYYSPMELDFGSCGHDKEIDWEQRRYEIAKEIFLRRTKDVIEIIEDSAEIAVKCADILIEELRKGKRNEIK